MSQETNKQTNKQKTVSTATANAIGGWQVTLLSIDDVRDVSIFRSVGRIGLFIYLFIYK